MNPGEKNNENTLLVMVTGFSLLYLVSNWQPFVFIAVVVGNCGIFFPSLSAYIVAAWYKLAEWLGFINSKVILSVVFFLGWFRWA